MTLPCSNVINIRDENKLVWLFYGGAKFLMDVITASDAYSSYVKPDSEELKERARLEAAS